MIGFYKTDDVYVHVHIVRPDGSTICFASGMNEHGYTSWSIAPEYRGKLNAVAQETVIRAIKVAYTAVENLGFIEDLLINHVDTLLIKDY